MIVADTDRTFNYNSAIGRYAYIADGAELEFDLNNSGSATIGLRAYIKSVKTEKQYLFELYDGQTTIALYIDANGKICLEALGQSFTTSLSFRTGYWNFVGFTFSQTIASDSTSLNNLAVKIVVEGNEYANVVASVKSVSRLYCSVGRKHNVTSISTSFGSYEEAYPLHGQIEMLSLNKNYSSLATLTTLKSNLELSDKITGYNEFGMLASSVIKTNQQDIMRKTITYKSKPGSTKNKCLDIASEANFFYGKGTTTRAYETDNLGRLTKVTDALFGNHTYSYDEKGYLKAEDTASFSYDANGNITQAGTKKYEYNGAIKDRLTKALGYDVDYNDTNNPGNPTGWNGRTYGWDWSRRLVLFQNNGTYTSYSYNAEGLRTSKTHNSTTTEYFYSGNRLIAEKNPIYKLNFLYDENGLLYGFIKDNSSKYFYIRDVYQNILGIIDNTGAIVVKYSYDVWGNHKVLDGNGNENTSSSFIGNINPFRYKGYYYDSETGLYLVTSRYYNPEWCRFISPDSIEYLDPSNINGMNLYAYCNNDPVNYYDPSGCFAISTLIILGLIAVGAVVGGTVAGVNSYNNGNTGWKLVGDVLGGALIGGAIGGITGYFVAPGIAAMLSSTGTIGGALAFAGGLGSTGAGIAISSVGQLALAVAVTSVGVLSGITVMATQTRKSGGYYGERWPGDPHKPDHVHLRGNGIDIRIGRDGKPLPGENKLNSQARKALKRLWDEFVELFNRW